MFLSEGGETAEQVAWRGGACPFPETFRDTLPETLKVRLDRTLRSLISLKMSLITAGLNGF